MQIAVSGDINDHLKARTTVLDGSMLDVHVSKLFCNMSNGETHWVYILVDNGKAYLKKTCTCEWL